MEKKTSSKNTGGKSLLFFSVILIIILIDQFTKYLVRNYLTTNTSIIDNFFQLTQITNTCAAFGIFKDFNTPLIWLSVLIIGVILFYYHKVVEKNITALSSALIVGGAIGNIIDRITFGHVIDFLDFYIKNLHWPAFNIADSCITVGMVILVIHLYRSE